MSFLPLEVRGRLFIGGIDLKAAKRNKTPKSSTPFSILQSVHASEASIYKGTPSHKFEVFLEPTSFTREKFELFAKYQADVHSDHEQSENRFTGFLVDSPLEYSPIPYTKDPPEHLPLSYGSYHQLYRLDGKLVALSILDILPFCISSSYFMYDTTWERFSLGTLSVMREAALVKEIQSYGASEMKFLYMGYYVPSSKKMRYKGDYFPSYLLDPEKYSWHPLQPVVSMLDKYRYVSFANPAHSLEGRNVPAMDPEYEISDEEASGIWCEDDSDGCQPLKDSIYWEEPSQRTAILQTIEYLGIGLASKSTFTF